MAFFAEQMERRTIAPPPCDGLCVLLAEGGEGRQAEDGVASAVDLDGRITREVVSVAPGCAGKTRGEGGRQLHRHRDAQLARPRRPKGDDVAPRATILRAREIADAEAFGVSPKELRQRRVGFELDRGAGQHDGGRTAAVLKAADLIAQVAVAPRRADLDGDPDLAQSPGQQCLAHGSLMVGSER